MKYCGINLPRASKRLLAVFEEVQNLATKDDIIVDVGSDHGYLPVMLAKSGEYKRIVATDISGSSLKKTEELAKKHGVNVECIKCDGLEKVSGQTLVSICGIGANEIIKILKNSNYRGKIILQPVPSELDLRQYLLENDYHIAKDYVIEDNKKFYFIFVLDGKQKRNNYSKNDMLFGKTNLKARTNDFELYLENQINKLKFLENFDITKISKNSRQEIKEKKAYLKKCAKLMNRKELCDDRRNTTLSRN